MSAKRSNKRSRDGNNNGGGGVYIYTRVSSAQQNSENSVSLDVQLQKIREYVVSRQSMSEQANSIPAGNIVTEVGSAYKRNRQPKLDRLIGNCARNSTIYVYSYDRFSRNLKFALEKIDQLQKKNVSLVSVTEVLDNRTAAGRMQMISLIGSAECSSRLMGEKLSVAMKYRQALGNRPGNAPYGYQKRKHVIVDSTSNKSVAIQTFVPHPEEQKVVQFIVALRESKYDGNFLNQLLFRFVQEKVALTFSAGDTTIAKPDENKISFTNIAEILEDYSVGGSRKWTGSMVSRIYQREHVGARVAIETLFSEKTKTENNGKEEERKTDGGVSMMVTVNQDEPEMEQNSKATEMKGLEDDFVKLDMSNVTTESHAPKRNGRKQKFTKPSDGGPSGEVHSTFLTNKHVDSEKDNDKLVVLKQLEERIKELEKALNSK